MIHFRLPHFIVSSLPALAIAFIFAFRGLNAPIFWSFPIWFLGSTVIPFIFLYVLDRYLLEKTYIFDNQLAIIWIMYMLIVNLTVLIANNNSWFSLQQILLTLKIIIPLQVVAIGFSAGLIRHFNIRADLAGPGGFEVDVANDMPTKNAKDYIQKAKKAITFGQLFLSLKYLEVYATLKNDVNLSKDVTAIIANWQQNMNDYKAGNIPVDIWKSTQARLLNATIDAIYGLGKRK